MASRLTILFTLAASLLVLGSGCGPASRAGAPPDLSDRPIRVVATIGQIGDIVRNVGGERVDVEGLMGPGVDPHLYKASEGDVGELADADIVFYNGLHLEGKMGDVLDRLADTRPVIAVTEDIPREELRRPAEFEGNYDPHVWFDVSLWIRATERVRRALAEVDPTHAAFYQENAAAYIAELNQLDIYARERIASIPAERRVLVTAHDAFGYFGRRYGIEVLGLQGISTDAEAGIEDVRRVADVIAARDVKAIFVETSVSSRTVDAVRAAVADRGGHVTVGGSLFSDAMGEEGTPEGTYIGMFRHNVDTIVAALL